MGINAGVPAHPQTPTNTTPAVPAPDLTIAQLLGWILAALFLQASVGIGVAIWRRPRGTVEAGPAAMPPARSASNAAWAGTREFRVTSRAYEDTARSQCSFYLQPVDGQPLPEFRPGQFLTFVLQVIDEAGAGKRRSVTRCYSLSDAPAPDHYRVSIKRVPPPSDRRDLAPGVSSTHFHDHVQVGDVLQVKAPSGHFHIDPDSSVPAVLVAGGIGITPMMSMLRWCLARQPGRDVSLYYGLRQGNEHAFKSQLEELASVHPRFKLNVVYSRPAADDVQGRDFQHTGHVDLALLQRTLPHGRHQFYICGPAAMMESLVPALAEWGVPDADVHFEAFGPASVRKAGPASAATRTSTARATSEVALEVQFKRSGRTLSWDGSDDNLLDFAERHGVAVDSGCRSGSCGSCETRLLAGSVDYAQRPDHDAAPGHCLLCVGRPASALVLDA
jgi:ferredoxin-NADP reductase